MAGEEDWGGRLGQARYALREGWGLILVAARSVGSRVPVLGLTPPAAIQIYASKRPVRD